MSCSTCNNSCGCDTPLEKMNPGIRSTVSWLRQHGFRTVDSGDGVTNEFGCDLPMAYVHMKCRPEGLASETDRLVGLLKGEGVNFDGCPNPQDDPDGASKHPNVEAFYLPLGEDKYGFISIFNVIIPEGGVA